MKSKNLNFELSPKSALLRNAGVKVRSGEIKNLDYLSNDLQASRFLILGISEWIGPFANYGRPGADKAFDAFLSFFLSQPNTNESFDLLGNIVFTGTFPQDIDQAGILVEELDAFVQMILTDKLGLHQLPIVIGGGHNNALPLLRWARANRNVSRTLNIDAHFDCRSTHRRHSGNAFSTAILEGTLSHYTVLGIDSYAINGFIRAFIAEHEVNFVPLVHYLQGKSFVQDVIHHVSAELPIGLDIDMDSIENMPSSAQSPSGLTLNQVRLAMLSLSKRPIAYLHLCEGAPTNANEDRTLGKALCFLVLDFMQAME